MVKRSRLLSALDAYQGKNNRAEQQKSIQKKAARRRKDKHSVPQLLPEREGDGNSAIKGSQAGYRDPEAQSITQVGSILRTVMAIAF